MRGTHAICAGPSRHYVVAAKSMSSYIESSTGKFKALNSPRRSSEKAYERAATIHVARKASAAIESTCWEYLPRQSGLNFYSSDIIRFSGWRYPSPLCSARSQNLNAIVMNVPKVSSSGVV
jgi:hypothetical protein